MTMVGLSSLCESAVVSPAHSKGDSGISRQTWQHDVVQQYDQNIHPWRKVKPSDSPSCTVPGEDSSLREAHVSNNRLHCYKQKVQSGSSGFHDSQQTLPLIVVKAVQCLVCGTSEITASSAYCKMCEERLNGRGPEALLKEDLEFLRSLKQDKLPRKRIRSNQIHAEHAEETIRIKPEKYENMKQVNIEAYEHGAMSPDAKRRRRHDEWTRAEIIILLQCTKLLIDCELKCVSQALYHFTSRKPGKCFGRAAEKKLKRLEVFENWRKSNKQAVVARIDLMLRHYEAMAIPLDIVRYCDQLKAQSSNRSLALAKALINTS